jgi:thiol:disulfide interchange protein DsbD
MTDYFFHYLAFFLYGVAVNLTPGVYPLMTVTVLSFGPLPGQLVGPAGSFGRALVYLLGVAAMYCSLGMYAAFTGTPFGGILQNKPVILAGAFLMSGLALSTFGLFKPRVPPDLLPGSLPDNSIFKNSHVENKELTTSELGKNAVLGQAPRSGRLLLGKSGVSRFFLFGMTAAVISAPCVGRPAVAVLASVADKGDVTLGLLSFLVFSIGLGLPGFIPGGCAPLVKKFTRPAGRLSRIELFSGVILLGFAFYYFTAALRPALAGWVLPAFLILGGIYFGFIERSSAVKRAAGAAVILSGVALTVSLLVPGGTTAAWDEYKLYKLSLARQRQQPVVIDFYADWCVTCHELEKSVFSDPAVIEALGGFVRLRVDATDMMVPAVQEALQSYEVFGLPAVIFLGPEGQEIEAARVSGYVPPAEFLRSVQLALDKARAIFSSSSGRRIR